MKLFMVGLIGVGIVVFFIETPQTVMSTTFEEESEFELKLIDNIQPQVTARAYGVFDIETGDLLISNNINEPLPIASITKLFTAAEALESTSIDETIEVTASDVAAEGRAGKLIVGQKYTLRELLFPLLLESSNDAAATFERTTGTALLADRHLADASGLSAANKATVAELSSEVRDLYHSNPYVFSITRLPQYIVEQNGWVNNSPVLDLPGYLGGKHGYTIESNRTLAAIFSEPTLGGRALGYVILGSDDVRADVLELKSLIESSVQIN